MDKQVAERQQQVAAARDLFRLQIFEKKLAALPEAVRADTKLAYRVDQETGDLTSPATYSVGKTPWWISVLKISR